MENASRLTMDSAGKSGSLAISLFLSFNVYEADGITPRLLNRFETTNRILEEYGITRRVLEKYGITHRILNEYAITRRILNQYGVTRRVLEKYGITPRLLSQFNDQATPELLADYDVSDDVLLSEGLTQAEIDDFNRLSALLTDFNITIEEFVEGLESAVQEIRVKISIDGANLGISIELASAMLEAFLEEIGDDEDILFAEPDITIDTALLGTTSGEWYDKQVIPWGITHTETPIPTFFDLFTAGYAAKNPVHVFILDSGALENSMWDDLYYVEKKDFTMLFENPDQLEWDEDLAEDVTGFDPGDLGNPYDESGHGTHIAGTIGANNDLIGVVGVAPFVRIHSLKVLTKEGRTDITTLLAAVDYVTRTKEANPEWPIVVNMSLGVDIGTTSYNILDEAVKESISKGVVYVAAAGNNGEDASTYSPAHVEEVITVGAYNEQSEFSSFSNHGTHVDILAPGENIISLSHIIEDTQSFESVLASGTSQAAPHVTGAIARYLGENPYVNAGQVAKALQTSANTVITGVPNGTTNKSLNVNVLLQDVLVLEEGELIQDPYYVDENKSLTDASSSTDASNDDSGSSNSTGFFTMDDFSTQEYSGSHGSTDWSGDWIESGESNGYAKGDFRVIADSKCAEGHCLRIDTDKENKALYRAVDLSGSTSPTLSFDYRRKDLESSNLHLEVSSDAGATWSRIFTFSNGNDAAQVQKTLDISKFVSSTTQIRFIVNGQGDNYVFIDNVQISF